ncbi:hypothetical protein A2872_00185 [Candidatus Gottesmanbacteria bacterium RIFCSPHIGHO2_01_FULL_42_12]|uniref:Cyanophycin synthase-like N-terminal domain-containing protein n=1 Tax=Candidatus Gottesmanbacteria bacterium RIFCSPHIGHO2_01_FULL_42_12 TaxID=1798377 RepID=A0A1F5YZM3_9BACT|nr:MAG: hypothetical protein A2872_00185 [Candidatus Gottesmanbacteria bacterium RIFCSPHIGHO2_01_FULL_42_12]
MDKNYASQNFTIDFLERERKTDMVMKMLIPVVNTSALPRTYAFLTKNSPTVLKTHCFNEENLPFSMEVKATEIGHLFEHLLLDHICLAKVRGGAKLAQHCGRTDWNWERDPWGLFHISIDCGKKDREYFREATFQSISLLEKLLETEKHCS